MGRPSIAIALLGLLSGCGLLVDLDAPTPVIVQPPDAAPDATPDGIVDAAGAPDADVAPPADAAPSADARPDGAAPCDDPDGDGHGPGCASPLDCAPRDRSRHPGAPERCDGLDDDCDGRADEDFAGKGEACAVGDGACRGRGRFVCSADGRGLRCDAEAGAGTAEICDDVDSDCDGRVDEGVPNCCAPGDRRPCGSDVGACRVGEQSCNADRVWEGCTAVGPEVERCNGDDDDCDGQVDEGLLNACGACGPPPTERCDGEDDDCDGRVDEGTLNACGACGPTPIERCDGDDDDCDGAVDEGLLNACGGCGPVPEETCDDRDEDCDGRVDEGVRNACGACGPPLLERCDGRDEDCDGQVDEENCTLYILDELSDAWFGWPPLPDGPEADGEVVQEAVAVTETNELWAFTADRVYVFDLDGFRWRERFDRDALLPQVAGRPLQGAYALPAWWRQRFDPMAEGIELTVQVGGQSFVHQADPVARTALFDQAVSLDDAAWSAPDAPSPGDVRGVSTDLRNASGHWPGSPADLCGRGGDVVTVVLGVYTGQAAHGLEAGHCFGFLPPVQFGDFAPLTLPRAPAPGRIRGWAHLDAEDGGGHTGLYLFAAP
ncbi:MAG: hypothetical protein H6704_26105 [Myxococcales bacterium]|nr:hypothetical protein [Myxococcales bacterium]